MIFGNCDGWCPPVVLYLVLSVFSIVMRLLNETKFNAKIFISQLINTSIFTFILYLLCTHCYETSAWVILLLPLIIGLLTLILVAEYMAVDKITDTKTSNNDHKKVEN